MPGYLFLGHLEHLGVGAVRALHLRGVLDQDFPHLFVETVLHRQLVGDDLGEALHDPGRVVDLELALRQQGLDDLAGDELDLVGVETHLRTPSITSWPVLSSGPSCRSTWSPTLWWKTCFRPCATSARPRPTSDAWPAG